MPTFWRPICASCVAWSTAKIFRSIFPGDAAEQSATGADPQGVTGRVITELESLSEKEPENFARIWDAFGSVIKEGLYEDYERREKLLALSRFTTTAGENAR